MKMTKEEAIIKLKTIKECSGSDYEAIRSRCIKVLLDLVDDEVKETYLEVTEL